MDLLTSSFVVAKPLSRSGVGNTNLSVSTPRWCLKFVGRGTVKSAMPELSSEVKAAHVKPRVHFLCHLAAGAAPSGDIPLYSTAVFCFCQCLHITDRSPLRMSHPDADSAAHYGRQFLLAYSQLATRAHAGVEKFFNLQTEAADPLLGPQFDSDAGHP